MIKNTKLRALYLAYLLALTSLTGCSDSPIYRSSEVRIVNDIPNNGPQIFIHYYGNQYVLLETWDFIYLYDKESLDIRNNEIKEDIEDMKESMPIGGYLRKVAKRRLEDKKEELELERGAIITEDYDILPDSEYLIGQEKEKEFWTRDELFMLLDRIRGLDLPTQK